jgi:hypothetical protein
MTGGPGRGEKSSGPEGENNPLGAALPSVDTNDILGEGTIVGREQSIHSEIVSNIVNSLANAETVKEVLSVLDTFVEQVDGMEKVTATTYSLGDYVFNMDNLADQNRLYERLITATELGLGSAPELLHHVPLDKFGVMVTRLRSGSIQDHEAPYSRDYSFSEEALFDPKAVSIVRADMETLIDNGYIHQAAADGFECWLVNRESGAVSLTAWQSLQRAESADDLDDFRAAIEKLLASPAPV